MFLLNDCNLSKSTPGIYESVIRYALHKTAREKIIIDNPASRVKAIKKPESDRVFLSADEVKELADTHVGGRLGSEIKKAFLFSCYTGLRISDLKTIMWGDIEHNPLQIIKKQKKTGRRVYIPLNNTAWKIINNGSVHCHTELIFPSVGSTEYVTNKYLTRWAQKAGIHKKIGWHTARHTFAVLSLESGADIYTVSKLLGHTDVKTTQVYAKATDKMKRETVNALPQLDIEGGEHGLSHG